jgi:hypothetical protein
MKSQDNSGCFNPSIWLWRQKAKGEIIKILAFYLLPFTFFALPCLPQEAPVSFTYKSLMIGSGTSSAYDSYLSPLKYTGNNFGLYYEHIKNTGLMNGNVSAQQLMNANYSWSQNKTGNASYYSGIFEYNYGLYYRFKPTEKWQLFTGAQAGGLLGFVYNTRNGNNPATGKAHLNLNLAAIANYRTQIHSQPVDFRYQLSLPFIGVMYAPPFGQSYYEIGLGNTKGLGHLSSLHNYFSVRNVLSVEIPLNWFALRFSYQVSVYETRINDVNTQLINNTFYIGLSGNFFVVSGKQRKNNHRYVFE